MRARAYRCHIGTLLVALMAPVGAQAVDEGALPGGVRLGAGSAASVLARPSLGRPLGIPPAAPVPRVEAWSSRLSIVELPPEGVLVTARRHRAISIPFDGARRAFKGLGIDATDCALQLRVPTRLRRDAVAGARATVELQAQVRLACRM